MNLKKQIWTIKQEPQKSSHTGNGKRFVYLFLYFLSVVEKVWVIGVIVMERQARFTCYLLTYYFTYRLDLFSYWVTENLLYF